MKVEEIIEGNKLIAEFMGFKSYYYSGESNMVEVSGKMKSLNSWAKYHSSWDWLMPVVNKCYNLQYKQGWKKENCIQYCLASYDFMSDIAIIIVWEEVVRFITWYNNQKKK
jgi:hypothetical protein